VIGEFDDVEPLLVSYAMVWLFTTSRDHQAFMRPDASMAAPAARHRTRLPQISAQPGDDNLIPRRKVHIDTQIRPETKSTRIEHCSLHIVRGSCFRLKHREHQQSTWHRPQ
jgi:hypothetical protein